MSDDARLSSPAALRNRDPILQVLRRELPPSGTVLEIASGTGEHVAWFAAALPQLHWQPTDPAPAARASIDARTAGLPNAAAAQPLDTTGAAWPVRHADAVLCINMVHISPWAATVGLFAGSARVLGPGGLLALYGPFRHGDHPLQPGNAAFDADLRARNPAWGVRDTGQVAVLAAAHGFGPAAVAAMPADNLMLLFRRG